MPTHVEVEQEPPYHILMEQTPEERKRRSLLENDYLSRRSKAVSTGVGSLNETSAALWSGASSLEQALVECCEFHESDGEAHGGALSKGKEMRFAAILARDCHSVGSRSLALAILERSLEKDRQEAREWEDDSEDACTERGDSKGTSVQEAEDDDGDTKPKATVRENGHVKEPTDDNDADDKPKAVERENGEATESMDTQKDEEDSQQEASAEDSQNEESDDERDDADRMSAFLGAGGLKLLSQWLVDATTPIHVAHQQSGKTKPETIKMKLRPSPTAPLLLPLLSVLEHMPFDKKLVVESKINKQIRRISKQVDSLAKKGDPHPAGLDVPKAQEAINSLKSAWESHARNQTRHITSIPDPFEQLKRQMAQGLQALQSYEAGESEKPEWLARMAASEKGKERKKTSKPSKKRLSTQQLAAQERALERNALRDRLKAAEKERKEHLARLRELSKRKVEVDVHERRRKKKKKSVSWKDGLSSMDKFRKRVQLEEIWVIPQYFEDEGNDGESPDEDKAAEGRIKDEGTNGHLYAASSTVQSVDSSPI